MRKITGLMLAEELLTKVNTSPRLVSLKKELDRLVKTIRTKIDLVKQELDKQVVFKDGNRILLSVLNYDLLVARVDRGYGKNYKYKAVIRFEKRVVYTTSIKYDLVSLKSDILLFFENILDMGV